MLFPISEAIHISSKLSTVSHSGKPSKYKDASGKYNKKYLLNKDGFVFLAFGFTGKEADAWKWKYIDAFNRMERLVYEKNTAAYQIADQEERTTRRAETDVIKEFVE